MNRRQFLQITCALAVVAALPKVAHAEHAPSCGYHLDQYPWECDCKKVHLIVGMLHGDYAPVFDDRIHHIHYGSLPPNQAYDKIVVFRPTPHPAIVWHHRNYEAVLQAWLRPRGIIQVVPA